MRVVRSPGDMRDIALALRAQGRRIGLVPTMGALHEGHLSLVHLARPHCDTVVVSLFVNPIQFGPQEDLAAYPREFARDQALCAGAGADLLFAPESVDMYPAGFSTRVDEAALSQGLCGGARPGHFLGVCTVVAKLFNLCQPTLAVFGEKDAQQLRVIKRMVRDLDFPVEILAGPIVREPDGLAMSSRNRYLTPEERAQAPVLRRGLDRAQALVASGERDGARVLAAVRETIASAPLARIDYAELVDDEHLTPVATIEHPALLALAVHFGRARLLDNQRLVPGGHP